jgi:DNA-binding NtrC family response regulator
VGHERDTLIELVSSTERKQRAAVVSAGRLCLVILGEGLDATFPLPESGRVTIGRSKEAEIRIDHASVSRNHAQLTIGNTLTIEDLGSSNGTRVREVWLDKAKPAEIALGEPIDVGSVMVVVQQRAAPVPQRHIWAHGYFEARLEEECARAERSGGRFAVLRLHCTRPDPRVEPALGRILRTMDVIGYYGPADYEALIPDSRPEMVADVSERLVTALAELGIAGRIGAAQYPEDARDPYTLLRRASSMALGEPTPTSTGEMLISNPSMQNLEKIMHRVAAGQISVLITGETGVGKEVLAERVHNLSPRAERPFLRLNCAALSESLLESELFGHERGAFTGAVATKPGLLETAHGGTVFLDEIGELPMSIQVKLLRVIEERKVLRVGGLQPREIEVRFLAATNRDLEAEIARGAFRQDLYFRINGVTLVIPPLRARAGEIPGLAKLFVKQASERGGHPAPEISMDAMSRLVEYDWPGNIRELRNVMERAALLCSDGVIRVEHLPTEKMRTSLAPVEVAPAVPAPAAPAAEIASERDRIIAALTEAGGNQTDAARLLGVSRRTLINRVIAYKIPRPRKK